MALVLSALHQSNQWMEPYRPRIHERWVEHFQSVLNHKSTFDTQLLSKIPHWPTATHLDDVSSVTEIEHSVRQTASGKSPEKDGISAEVPSSGVSALLDQLHKLFCAIWEQESLPMTSVELSTYRRRSFTASGPIVWNSLPEYLRDPTLSVDTFRRYLKTHFLRNINIHTTSKRSRNFLTACAIHSSSFHCDCDYDSKTPLWYTFIMRKGDRAVCDNHRGISLLSIAAKVLAGELLNRLNGHVKCSIVIPESQCGFRSGRGTMDMIFTARQV